MLYFKLYEEQELFLDKKKILRFDFLRKFNIPALFLGLNNS